ncbi:MAG: PH domain-containing protein [Bacteroidales bacterium]
MKNTYKVKWSPVIKTITILLAISFICIELTLSYKLANHHNLYLIALTLFFNLMLFILIINIPTTVTLDTTGITLKKVYGKIHIRYDEINTIKSFQPISDIRVFGSGGFGGYIGIFSNEQYGWYHSFVGNPKQSFIIMTNKKKAYAFSCENNSRVIDTIKKELQTESLFTEIH